MMRLRKGWNSRPHSAAHENRTAAAAAAALYHVSHNSRDFQLYRSQGSTKKNYSIGRKP